MKPPYVEVLEGELVVPEPIRSPAPRPSHGSSLVRSYVTITERDRCAAAWFAAATKTTTETARRTDIAEFFDWLDQGPAGEPLPFDAVRRQHVDLYRRYLYSDERVAHRAARKRLAHATVARKLSIVSSFYDYVLTERDGWIAGNPCARASRPTVDSDSMTTALTSDEAAEMLRAADRRGLRESAFVRLMMTTGLRVSEACQADSGDLERVGKDWTLVVVRKGGKRRRILLVPDTARALRRYVRGRRGPLFLQLDKPDRLTRTNAWHIVDKVGKAASLPGVHPHRLRHTAATLALKAGRELHVVQDMMDHTDPKTTMRYLHASIALEDSAINTLGGLFADLAPLAEGDET